MISPKIDQILKSVEQLKPLPTSVSRVLRALDDPKLSASYLGEIIGLDQALAASVLQMANSALSGYGPNCSTLADAIMRLGFKRIKMLAMASGASGSLSNRLYGYRLGAGQLWNHSVATGTTAQWLAQYFHYPSPEEAYIAGLLHDMGKLLLDQYISLDYQEIFHAVQVKKKMLSDVEEELIGINHAKVGSLMAEKWNFPPVLVEAIYCHHTPSLAFENPRLASIVNMANAFTNRREVLGLADAASQVVHPSALSELRIAEHAIPALEQRYLDYLRVNQGM